MVAGEASGDIHGSRLAAEIRRMSPQTVIRGMGGPAMAREGVELLISSSDVSVVGLTEVLTKLPALRKAMNTLKTFLKKRRPDLIILIDYPEFNLHLSGCASRLGIPVLYYISPQIWAWRKGRIKKIARRVSQMAVILPFEEDFYKKAGIKVTYVGHPIMDAWPFPVLEAEEDLRLLRPVIGLLPGSRIDEVRRLLPEMLKAGDILSRRYRDLSFVLPEADSLPSGLIDSCLKKTSLKVEVIRSGIYQALTKCHAAIVASGTATLDTAIMAVPMVIVYRVSHLSYIVGRMVIDVPFIGLVNLVAGEEVAPELIQGEATASNMAGRIVSLLEDEGLRRRTIEKLGDVRKRLGTGGASSRTAEIALEMMGRNSIILSRGKTWLQRWETRK